MNPFTKDSSGELDSVESEAAAWLMEVESGLTPEQAAAFARWTAEDPLHAAAVARLRSAWGELLRLRNYRPDARCHPDPELLSPARPRVARNRFVVVATGLVAAAVVALALRATGWLTSMLPDDQVRYVTAAGGYHQIAMPDGSVLALNASSEARVRFSKGERFIRLVKGEGHFVVAPDAGRPFVVEADGVQVTAIGTEFNVRTGNQALEVLVTHGRVKVTPAHAIAAGRADAPTLGAGERGVLADVTSLSPDRPLPLVIENVSLTEVRSALAWQSPQLHFLNATLADAARQFNQRGHLQLVLADAELEKIPVGGSFRPENVEAFVRLLESANEVRVESRDADRIVLRSPARTPDR